MENILNGIFILSPGSRPGSHHGVLAFKNIFWEHVRVWSSLAPDKKFGPGQGPNFWLKLSVVGKDRDSVRRGGGYYPHPFLKKRRGYCNGLYRSVRLSVSYAISS